MGQPSILLLKTPETKSEAITIVYGRYGATSFDMMELGLSVKETYFKEYSGFILARH